MHYQGKKSYICRKFFSALLGAGLFIFHGLLTAEPSRVCLVNSEKRQEYDQTSTALVATLREGRNDIEIEESRLGNSSSREDQFWSNLVARQPDLIVTVGPLATRSAVEYVKKIPIIFTLILDDLAQLHSNSSAVQLSGVTLSIPVEEQLGLIKEALPGTRSIGLLYSQQSAQMYQMARRIAGQMGLRLAAQEVATERDIPSALRSLIPQIDVFWMPPDNVVYDQRFPHIRRFILLECFQNSVPIVAMSVHMATAGAPLALGIDYTDIGRQTAELVRKRLAGRSVPGQAIENPNKVVVYINEWVASSLKLNIPKPVLDKAVPVKSER